MLFKNMDRDYLRSLFRASVLGIHIVAGTFAGLAIGYFLDKWLQTTPWLTLIFLLLGIAAGFKNVHRDVKSILQDEAKQKKKQD
ncbi:MAG: AtpZ/AtpI family protein [Desulfohalobiaceae bacterium]